MANPPAARRLVMSLTIHVCTTYLRATAPARRSEEPEGQIRRRARLGGGPD